MNESITNIGVGITDTPQGLFSIMDDGCAAVVWRRRPLESFQSWIDGVEPEKLPNVRMILPSHRVREALLYTCESSGTPDCEERDRLVDDAAALADIFSRVIPSSYVQLRMDVVSGCVCPKFHIDAVKARLVCTYRGTGTQCGVASGTGEPRDVFTVPTGAPVLLRGKRWPEVPGAGLMHRSPPIEGTGETRLVLALDPVDEPEGIPDPETILLN